MAATPEEIQRREALARTAIKATYGTPKDKVGATLFVSHHLEEVEAEYWKKHLGTANPEPRVVLELLELKSHWGGEDEMDTFDFTLPGETTQYVISVRFDGTGQVSTIAMES